MQNLERQLVQIQRSYSRNGTPTDELRDYGRAALQKLMLEADVVSLGVADGKPYYSWRSGEVMSRPFRQEIFVQDPDEFGELWAELIGGAGRRKYSSSPDDINRAVYTIITAVSCVYDIWKPGSRKTPGTVFEIALGSLLSLVLEGYARSQHVILDGQDENVSTDIVFSRAGTPGGLVIPAKITTRERIVQPFAHQRILDSIFGAGRYRSVLICVSEMQRDGSSAANAVCVPGTVKLFQRHLSSIEGIYYGDPPLRYLQTDVTSVLPVSTIGRFLSDDLERIVTTLEQV